MSQLIDGYFSRVAKWDKVYRRMCFQAVEEYHFTPNEIVVLMFLANNKEWDSATDIARFKNISKGLVAKSVDLLCQKGFLRAEKDERDRRLIHLRLTEQSRGIVERLESCRSLFISSLEEGIPPENLQKLSETVEMLDRNLDRMVKGMREDEIRTGK